MCHRSANKLATEAVVMVSDLMFFMNIEEIYHFDPGCPMDAAALDSDSEVRWTCFWSIFKQSTTFSNIVFVLL